MPVEHRYYAPGIEKTPCLSEALPVRQGEKGWYHDDYLSSLYIYGKRGFSLCMQVKMPSGVVACFDSNPQRTTSTPAVAVKQAPGQLTFSHPRVALSLEIISAVGASQIYKEEEEKYE